MMQAQPQPPRQYSDMDPNPTSQQYTAQQYQSPRGYPAIQLQESSVDKQASGSRYRRARPDTEEIQRVGRSHYIELLSFLRSHLAKVEQTLPRSNAREKLTRLSKQQFTELSTDVYDELMRRQSNLASGTTQPFLAVREEFHPKRNQARQKLATLPRNRFKDLASDVFFELERRFPELKQEFRPNALAREREYERTLAERSLEVERDREQQVLSSPQPSTSDRIVPAKSTLVEEDVAVPYSASPTRDSVISSVNGAPDNRSTMYSQASSVGTGFFNGYAGSTAQSVASPNPAAFGFDNADALDKMRSDYELKVAKLQQQVNSLDSQMTEVQPRARKADELLGRNQELERQVEQLRADLAQSKQAHDQTRELHQSDSQRKDRELESVRKDLHSRSDIDALEREHAQQTDVVNELKQEVSTLLEELRELSARNDEMQMDKDSDMTIIKDLNNQVVNYKRMYESAKTELRTLKATSYLYVQQPKADDMLPVSDKGAIADVNLTAFQSSIDELLAAARSKTPGNVLTSMKTVVLSTTLVTDDVSKFEQVPGNVVDFTAEELEHLQQLKSKCSATLNNLMTACRNHASSHGLSPVSLLDAAASHVSSTIIGLVKLLKVRRASKTETDEFQANSSADMSGSRLKPLHISTQSANREVSGNHNFAGGLSPNLGSGNGEDRLSPRIRQSPQLGRYSPVGYKADTLRDTSGGSWRSRTASVSSVTSGDNSSAQMVDANSFLASRQASVEHGANGTSEGHTNMISGPAADRASSLGANGSRGWRSDTYDSQHTLSIDSDNTDENWAELRNYIEVQTEAIVHSIQALLSAIREGAQGPQLNENLTQITTIVSSIVAISRGNLPEARRAEGERILAELGDNCDKLSEMQSQPNFDKSTKSSMASASYGVAKGLKALNALFHDT